MARMKKVPGLEAVNIKSIKIVTNFLIDYMLGSFNYAGYKKQIEEKNILLDIKTLLESGKEDKAERGMVYHKLLNKVNSSKNPIKEVDALIANIDTTKDNNLKMEIGMDTGKFNLLLASNGVGKTTYIIQTMMNIIDMYETEGRFFDIENGLNDARIRTMSAKYDDGGDIASDYFKYDNYKIYSETIRDRVSKIIAGRFDTNKAKDQTPKAELRMKSPAPFHDNLEMTSPYVFAMDPLGKLETSSIATKLEADAEYASMTDGQIRAKANKAMLKVMKDPMILGNAIMFISNHLIINPDMGQFKKGRKGSAYMNAGESAHGGEEQFAIADAIIKMRSVQKLKDPDKEFGFVGDIVALTIVKSRNASPNTVVQMAFNHAEGYDELFSEYLLLKNNDRVNTGSWSTLEGLPDIKFRQKEFKQKYYSNLEFRTHFHTLLAEEKIKLVEPRVDPELIPKIIELNQWLLEPTRYIF